MLKLKDPSMIKLFGMTISLPPNDHHQAVWQQEQLCSDHSDHNPLVSSTTSSSSARDRVCNRVGEIDNKKHSESKLTKTTQEELRDPAASCDQNPKTPSLDREPTSPKSCNIDDQSETSVLQEKTLKKPDKILPCPRCSSMETKFCYYNNYNVSQPRHFCKNCQRYWTAGGSMRSVPVGSGRRKNKSSFPGSHYRHIVISEANGIHHPSLGPKGTVLSFSSDLPLSESSTSVLNIAEKSRRISVPCEGKERENGNEEFSESDSAEKRGNSSFQESVMQNFQTFPGQIPCFPMPPWSAIPPPAFSPSGYPVTFYQASPYWGGCTLPGPWNVPWFSPPNPNTQILGKHSRDGELLKPSNSENQGPAMKENNSERGVWMPKTLRIGDSSEAAKSSIWSTLGIKNETNVSINGGGLFKAFPSKGDGRNHRADSTSLVLQANPAALSRSLNFHECA